jgi:hypothetical protein
MTLRLCSSCTDALDSIGTEIPLARLCRVSAGRAWRSRGADDRHISTIDADGVALAAIQGLYQLVQERRRSSLNGFRHDSRG